MRLRPLLAAVLCASALAAAETSDPAPATVPPSPSTVSGERIWPEPHFTHWPAIVYADEDRNLSFQLPVKKAGTPGEVGWEKQPQMPIVLPQDTDRVSGLLPVPRALGTHVATLTIAGATTRASLRLVDAREPWPLASLSEGFPVDRDGVPVILVDRRRDPGAERTWMLLAQKTPRGTGKTLLVGDPLADLGSDTWEGIDAERRIAVDLRYPQHAVLVALANLRDPLPRTIVWSPGNSVLFGGAWSQEEERVLGVIRARCLGAGAMPRLVLLLPPIPLDDDLHDLAKQRRDLLSRSAAFQAWTVVDAEEAAGPAEQANRVQEGLYTRHPIGAARAAVTKALAAAIRD
jgi:hypothetical protein